MASRVDWQQRLRRLFTGSLSELNPFRGEQGYVGVDIGSSSIKVVHSRSTRDGLRVLGWGVAPTPEGAVQTNLVAEPAQVGAVLRDLLDSRGIDAREAVTAVPGPAVMIKRITLPQQGAKELENTVLFEAGNFIPEDLDNVNLDYEVTASLEGGSQIEVLLVAAKREIVNSYTEALRAAGLAPAVVDVDYFAIENAYELAHEPGDQVVALVNIGARYSSINILKGGRSSFTGDVPVGGRDVTDALSRDLGLPVEDAERVKAGQAVEGVDAEQVQMALGPAMDALIEEIHYALSFFWTAATDERVDRLVLSGGAARMPGLAERLEERAEVPVQVADPLQGVQLAGLADAQELRARGPEFMVAMGLAIRRPNDRS